LKKGVQRGEVVSQACRRRGLPEAACARREGARPIWERVGGIVQAADIARDRERFSAILAPLTLDQDEDSPEVKKAVGEMKTLAEQIAAERRP
jgi:hypothetical protein